MYNIHEDSEIIFPGQGEEALLSSLKNIFSLQEWEENSVIVSKKNDSVIVVITPNTHIKVELDLPHWKAIRQ